jgi:hypothetical protein
VCAYDKPFFDLVTNTDMDGGRVSFGGRLMIRTDGDACLYCMDQLAHPAVRLELLSPERRKEVDKM